MSRPITSNVIESILQKKKKKHSQQTKIQDQMASQVNSTTCLENTLASILLKLFQKIAEESLLWGQYYPDTKTRQRYHKKIKLKVSITDESRYKNPKQIIS